MIFDNGLYIIAEIGVNHNGSLALAKEMVLAAKKSGADAVKFQTFKAEAVLSKNAMMAAYQVKNTGENKSQLEMVKKLELSYEDTLYLSKFCEENEITFLSTPFDNESLEFLVKEVKVPILKVSSADITNLPLLYEMACTEKFILLSTGMASLGEIEDALGVFSFVAEHGTHVEPSLSEFRLSYSKPAVRALLSKRVCLLHCVTQYPADVRTSNLKAITTLQGAFPVTVGYSDHTLDSHAAVCAVSLGAVLLEKHFTLDNALEGPDHAASMNPDDFLEFSRQTRDIQLGLGDGVKFITAQEQANFALVRRSLVALRDIEKGELFSKDNIGCKRAGVIGLSPSLYWDMLNSKAKRAFQADEILES